MSSGHTSVASLHFHMGLRIIMISSNTSGDQSLVFYAVDKVKVSSPIRYIVSGQGYFHLQQVIHSIGEGPSTGINKESLVAQIN
ncbi:hypothetical protein GDO81_010974 [Engystomops pustulosus]|uniref:Uncharacterized protein n=1 Tax=Engystomops pustulosus TaxID=76066 RepID=A0AAV7C5G1_ENGPU|nr:hypothetical protein GDO81_010974 [Engystomops pustulosus]